MASQMRARDVREQLKGRVEPRVQHILEALAENQHQLMLSLNEMATIQNKLIDTLDQLVGVAANMRDANARLSAMKDGDELGDKVS